MRERELAACLGDRSVTDSGAFTKNTIIFPIWLTGMLSFLGGGQPLLNVPPPPHPPTATHSDSDLLLQPTLHVVIVRASVGSVKMIEGALQLDVQECVECCER